VASAKRVFDYIFQKDRKVCLRQSWPAAVCRVATVGKATYGRWPGRGDA